MEETYLPSTRPPVTRRDGDRTAPLPPTVAALWNVWRAGKLPDSVINLVHFAAYLDGPPDREKLERAYRLVAEKHEPLRMRIREQDGVPHLFHRAEDSALFHIVDVESSNAISSEEITQAVSGHVRDLVWAPFEFDEDAGISGPLSRAFLVDAGPSHSVFGFVFHQVIADGLSAQIAIRDLGIAFAQIAEGRGSAPPGLTIQYIDHIRSLNDWLATPEGCRAQTALAKSIAAIPRRAKQGTTSQIFPFRLPDAVSSRVRDLSIRSKLSVPALAITAQAIITSLRTSTDRLAIFLIHHGRDQMPLYRIIGHMAVPAPVWFNLEADPKFIDLARRAQADITALTQAAPIQFGEDDNVFYEFLNFVEAGDEELPAPFSARFPVPPAPGDQLRSQALMLSHTGGLLFLMLRNEELSGAYSSLLWGPDGARTYLDDVLDLLDRASVDPDIRLSALAERIEV